jgi:acyl transferase domain-containing protein
VKDVDPQQRMLLLAVTEALQGGGLSKDRAKGSNTSVFVGICNDDYSEVMRAHLIQAAFSNGLSRTCHQIIKINCIQIN